MITSLAKMIKPMTIYPEIEAAKFINITLSALTLINIFILSSIFIPPIYAFSLSFLVATNQLNILYSMDVTNEVIYAFFLTLVLILYHYQKKTFVYLLFGLLFLLRYESIVIPISVFIIEYYSKKPPLKIKNILFSFIPILLWLLVLSFHPRIGNSILGNAYIEEIINGLENIPNISVFIRLIEIITFDNSYSNNLSSLFLLITIGLCFHGITSQKSKSLIKIIYLVFGFSLLFIFMFPNFAVRYYIPIIWMTYFVLINQKSKIISTTILLCLLSYNIARINLPSNYNNPQYMQEYRTIANWLNAQVFTKPTIVLIYEPLILRYFVNNPQVNIIGGRKSNFLFKACQGQIVCICQILLTVTNTDADIFIITNATSQTDLSEIADKFTAISHDIKTFDDIYIKNNKNNFKYLTSVYADYDNNWANIWTYIPNP